MNKNIMIITLCMIFLFGIVNTNSVYSLSTSDMTDYYSFDTDASNDFGSIDLNNFSVTHYDTGGILKGYFNCTGSTISFLNRTGFNGLTEYEYFSINMWYKSDNKPTHTTLFSQGQGGNEEMFYALFNAGTTKWGGEFLINDDYWNHISVSITDTPLHVWEMFTLVRNDTVLSMYQNGTVIKSGTGLGGPYPDNFEDFFICKRMDSNDYPFYGGVDEISFWNRSLSLSEIGELWNSGTGYNPLTSTISITNHTMIPTIVNEGDNITCSANVTGSTSYDIELYINNVFFSSSLDCLQEFANISYYCGAVSNANAYSYDAGMAFTPTNIYDGDYATGGRVVLPSTTIGHLNETYKKPSNASSNSRYFYRAHPHLTGSYFSIPTSCWDYNATHLQFQLVSSSLDFPIYRNILSCKNSTTWVNITMNSAGSSGYTTIYEGAMAWTWNNSLTSDNYDLNDNITCNITAYNGTINVTSSVYKFVGQNITFTANNTRTGATITNFTITYSQGSFKASGDNITIYNWNTTENYYFTHPDYINANITLTTNITTQEYNFELYTTNSLNFFIRHAENHSLMVASTVYIEILSDLTTGTNYNISTSNGTYYLSGVKPGNYIVSATSAVTSNATQNIIVVNKTFQNVTIYMYDTGTTEIKYSVITNLGDKLEGAIVQALQSYGGNWNVVGECNTNAAGECSINLVTNDWYQYYVFYEDTLIPKLITTASEQLTYTTRTPFILDLTVAQYINYDKYNDVAILDFDYTNVSNNYTFRLQATYSSYVDNMCLRVYEGLNSTYLCDKCLNGSGNIIFCSLILSNSTYYADADSIIGDKEFNLEKYIITLKNNITVLGLLGVFLAFLITLTCGCVGLYIGSTLETTIGIMVGVCISTLIGLISLSWSSIIVLIIIAISISIRRGERGR